MAGEQSSGMSIFVVHVEGVEDVDEKVPLVSVSSRSAGEMVAEALRLQWPHLTFSCDSPDYTVETRARVLADGDTIARASIAYFGNEVAWIVRSAQRIANTADPARRSPAKAPETESAPRLAEEDRSAVEAVKSEMTPAQVAKRWGCASDKVRALIHSGELPAIDISTKRGGKPRFLIRLADVEAFEEGRRTQPPPAPAPRRRRRQKDDDVIEFF